MGCSKSKAVLPIILPSIQSDLKRSAIFGSVVGAFVGDAAGAPLEFKREWSQNDIDKAISMKGGGVFEVGEGQITDDSEMAMCLAWGLKESGQVLNVKTIARYYRKWIDSKPFDIGNTIRNALVKIDKDNINIKKTKEEVKKINMGSLSNGCLMRITPMIAWGYKLSDEEFDKAVREDSSLTHPNEIAQQAVVCYCICLKYLIDRFGDRKYAINKVEDYSKNKNYKDISDWIDLAKNTKRGEFLSDCSKEIGFLRHGFIHSIHYLYNDYKYEEAIREMLSKKGDTDTNACIVGGLIGAAEGYDRIPDKMKFPVLNFQGQNGIERDQIFYPSLHLANLINDIIGSAPSKLIVEGYD